MKNSQEKTYKYYDIIYDEWMPQKKTDSELEFIKKYATKTDTILDLGCGSGRHLVPLHQDGYNITGLDAVQQAIDLALEKDPSVQTIHKDFYDSDLKDGQFSLIYMMWNVFAEIAITRKQAEKLLGEVYKILGPKGRFIFDISVDTIPEQHLTFTQIVSHKDLDYKLDWKLLDYDSETRTTNCREKIIVTNHKDDSVVDSVEAIITQKWWKKKEVKDLAESMGFSISFETIKHSDYLYSILEK